MSYRLAENQSSDGMATSKSNRNRMEVIDRRLNRLQADCLRRHTNGLMTFDEDDNLILRVDPARIRRKDIDQ